MSSGASENRLSYKTHPKNLHIKEMEKEKEWAERMIREMSSQRARELLRSEPLIEELRFLIENWDKKEEWRHPISQNKWGCSKILHTKELRSTYPFGREINKGKKKILHLSVCKCFFIPTKYLTEEMVRNLLLFYLEEDLKKRNIPIEWNPILKPLKGDELISWLNCFLIF